MNDCWNLSGKIKLLLIFLTIVPLKTASFNLCEHGQVIHSDFKTGERACCVNVLCQAGTQPQICRKDDPSSTSCQHCQKGTFQSQSTNSSDMKHCEAKTTCYNNQIARFENSLKRDTICECNTDLGYCNSVKHQHRRLSRCVKKKCSEGLHLALNCSCLSSAKVKEIGVPRTPSCNSSSSICRNKLNLTTDENINTTYPEKSHGVTEGNLPAIQADQIQYTVISSSYTDPNSDSGNTVYQYLWFIILVIPIVMFGVVVVLVLIKKQSSSSSSPYSKHRLNDSRTSTSENFQLEDDDKSFKQVISEGEIPEIQRENQHRNCDELLIETQALINKHAAPSFSMSSSDKKKLSDNRCELVENLMLSPILWSVLLRNGTMTTEIRAQIERKGATESETNDLLINNLQKRSHFAFATFIASLIHTKQEHLATMLDQELTTKIKASSANGQLLEYVRDLSKSSPGHCERA